MPRLDRIFTFYLFAPLLRLRDRGDGRSVPILRYHSISDNLFGHSHPYYQINTSPAVFKQQMKWLADAGYRTVDLLEAGDALERGESLSKRIVITFDGGFRDVFTEAWPVMRQRGFTGTMFLATDRIQASPLRFEGADYLTWQDVRELHSEGMSFGSHTVTHPDLRSLEPEEIDYELGFSKEVIEQALGAPVRCFSYPFSFPEEDGDFKRYLSDALENHGFQWGVSNIIGRASCNSNRFFLPRLPVNSWDDKELLVAKLRGDYDWMHLPQWAHKHIHHNVTVMKRASQRVPSPW